MFCVLFSWFDDSAKSFVVTHCSLAAGTGHSNVPILCRASVTGEVNLSLRAARNRSVNGHFIGRHILEGLERTHWNVDMNNMVVLET